MNTPRKLRKLRRAKRTAQVASINLVSMIDIFVILIIYLLVNTAAVQVIGAEQVDLPTSLAQEQPRPNVAVLITDTDILVNGKAVMKVADVPTGNAVLAPLQQRLLQEAPKRAAQTGLEGEVNILAGKDIHYALLKRVMFTCTTASFAKISLGVIPSEGRS